MNSNFNTDHLQGSVISEMRVTKMANGQFKASSMGIESNHHDQATAVRETQHKLHDALLRGEIVPGVSR